MAIARYINVSISWRVGIIDLRGPVQRMEKVAAWISLLPCTQSFGFKASCRISKIPRMLRATECWDDQGPLNEYTSEKHRQEPGPSGISYHTRFFDIKKLRCVVIATPVCSCCSRLIHISCIDVEFVQHR